MWFFIYIALISTAGCLLVSYDRTLLRSARTASLPLEWGICGAAAAGGALPMLLMLLAYRHKTQRTGVMVLVSFTAVVWLIGYIIAMIALL